MPCIELRDHFAALIAPQLLSVKLLTSGMHSSMSVERDAGGELHMKVQQQMTPETGALYDEVAAEAYFVADALVRARGMRQQVNAASGLEHAAGVPR